MKKVEHTSGSLCKYVEDNVWMIATVGADSKDKDL